MSMPKWLRGNLPPSPPEVKPAEAETPDSVPCAPLRDSDPMPTAETDVPEEGYDIPEEKPKDEPPPASKKGKWRKGK